MKNIVLAFDGTWNTPTTKTPIATRTTPPACGEFYEAVSPSTPQGIEQIKWYEKGVGTNWYTKITGGVFGAGLSNRIQDGYQWLAENFAEGDQIYLVGFSRGAYTARSLVGMIRNAGLLLPDESDRTKGRLYRDEGPRPEALTFESYCGIRVRFLGVWDTVGSLIPVESFGLATRPTTSFTTPSSVPAWSRTPFTPWPSTSTAKLHLHAVDPVEAQPAARTGGAGRTPTCGGYADNHSHSVAVDARPCGAVRPSRRPDQVPDVPADLLAPLVDSYSRFSRAPTAAGPPFLRQIGGTRFGREEFPR
ncbi:MAG: DUF2235 domain-containing protein [Micropruina glycogenica]